jgi:hypothetical protein
VKKNERMKRNLGFINLFKLVGGLGGVGTRPKNFSKPDTRPDPLGF